MNHRPAVRRVWMPVLAVALAAGAVYGLRHWPNDEFPNDYRSMGSWLAVILAVLAVAFWLLFLSGMRWAARFMALFGAVLLLSGAALATIKSVEYQGNLWPIVHWRWERHARGPRESAPQVPIPSATAADFPEYRNGNRDGVVTGLTLARDWSAQPPKTLWDL